MIYFSNIPAVATGQHEVELMQGRDGSTDRMLHYRELDWLETDDAKAMKGE